MSLLSAVQTYIKTYTPLASASAPVFVDALGYEPNQYAIVPLPGEPFVEKYLDGSSTRQFSFAFQSTEATVDDAERLGNNEFYESFSAWMESQTNAGVLPALGTGKTAETIEAVNAGYLFQQGESGTAVYQITCRLQYSQVAP